MKGNDCIEIPVLLRLSSAAYEKLLKDAEIAGLSIDEEASVLLEGRLVGFDLDRWKEELLAAGVDLTQLVNDWREIRGVTEDITSDSKPEQAEQLDDFSREILDALKRGVWDAQEAKADRLEGEAKKARDAGCLDEAQELETLAKRYRAHEDGLPSA